MTDQSPPSGATGEPMTMTAEELTVTCPSGVSYKVAGGDVEALVDLLESWMVERFEQEHKDDPPSEPGPEPDCSLPDRLFAQPFNWSNGGWTIGSLRLAPPKHEPISGGEYGEYIRADIVASRLRAGGDGGAERAAFKAGFYCSLAQAGEGINGAAAVTAEAERRYPAAARASDTPEGNNG